MNSSTEEYLIIIFIVWFEMVYNLEFSGVLWVKNFKRTVPNEEHSTFVFFS